MIELGVHVTWDDGRSMGRVTDVFDRKVTWRLQGSDVQRYESNENPTYMIELNNGDFILKHRHELAILH